MSQAQPCIEYNPACVECRRDAGKDAAGTTWQCVGHVYLERDRLRTAQAERDHKRLRYDGMRADRDDWRKRCEDAQRAAGILQERFDVAMELLAKSQAALADAQERFREELDEARRYGGTV